MFSVALFSVAALVGLGGLGGRAEPPIRRAGATAARWGWFGQAALPGRNRDAAPPQVGGQAPFLAGVPPF